MLREREISRVMKEKYAELYTRLMSSARDSGLKILCNEVEDCIQDAFLLLYEKWDSCKDKNVSGWLYITAMNNLNNKLRVIKSRGKTASLSLDYENGVADKAAEKLTDEHFSRLDDLEDRQDMLQSIKGCVSEDEYSFLMDYYSDETTAKQIAQKYNITEAVAWKRRQRLVDRIRQTIVKTMLAITLSGCSLVGEGKGSDGNADAAGTRMLSKDEARAILAYLQRLPADQFDEKDLRLADICYGVIDDKFGKDEPDVANAMRVFKKRVNELKSAKRADERQTRRISKRAIIALVVVACLLVATAVCYALGWLPWIFSMTKDSEHYTVGITTGDIEPMWEDAAFMTTGLSDEFDAILKEYNMNLPLPRWLPDGMVYTEARIISDDETSTDIRGEFNSENTRVFIGITKYHKSEVASGIFLEQDDRVYEELERHGQKYIIYSNSKRMNAFWIAPPYNCIINTNMSQDDLIRMIKSTPPHIET